MQFKNDALRYGLVAQLFHWAIVGLIITQFFLANKTEGLSLCPAKIVICATLISFCMSVFGLAVLRFIWRWINPVTIIPVKSPRWQQLAAHISDWTIYGLILITPLIGWLMSSARNFPVSWFSLFTLT